jgi:hypothetical protein
MSTIEYRHGICNRRTGSSGQPAGRKSTRLGYFDLGTGIFEFLFGGGRFFLADVLFNRLGRSFYQVLGLLESQAGQLADGLDDVDL